MSPQINPDTLAHEQSSDESSEFQDTEIRCIDCGENFVWSAGEQLFFRDKNLRNPPKRCKDCKKAKNERLAAITAAQNAGVKQRIEVAVHCARCNAFTTVPFYPSQGRPVLCRSCFLEQNPGLLGSESN
ncbi:MAG: zinc-ribbon domain containing protein [Acidobacteria bacterium]|nr:zinc-ribbon domain containing protein [Acidobacteriota bacterium]MBK8150405.1 zinc-ribbon domain containing protein [Acidobacteriota bacterium]MBK8811402.1 zinc-ribbon domain containing protein [Acidobacteriota bacterium]